MMKDEEQPLEWREQTSLAGLRIIHLFAGWPETGGACKPGSQALYSGTPAGGQCVDT